MNISSALEAAHLRILLISVNVSSALVCKYTVNIKSVTTLVVLQFVIIEQPILVSHFHSPFCFIFSLDCVNLFLFVCSVVSCLS